VLQPLFVIIGFGGGVGSGSSAKDLIADVRRFDEQLGTDSSETVLSSITTRSIPRSR
jgi:hypothetical protein